MQQLYQQRQLSDEALAKAYDHYEEISIDKIWVTDLEFLEAALIYDRPIIIFSVDNLNLYF